MKLAAAKTDIGSVDTTAKSVGRAGPDKQGSDGGAPPFEDLLADLKGESKNVASANDVVASPSSTSGAAPASIAVPAAIGMLTPPSPVSSATGRSSPGTETSNDGTTAIDAFVGLLGKDAANGRNSKSSTPIQGGDNRVATLLKRLASKSDETDPSSTTPGAVVSAVPDAFSALLVGPAFSSTPASASLSLSAAPSPSVGANAVKDAVGALAVSSLSTRAPAKETPASDASGETVVTDVSISSHLAPFGVSQPAQNDGKSFGLAEPKVDSSEATTSAPSSAPESPHTAPISIGHEDPSPSVLAAQSTLAGSASAPVRAIAKAIGALASRPATADVPPGKSSVAVARTMTLQMSPASLGTVAVKMHMTGQSLDVQLSISDPQTLGMVTRERDSLAAALHGRQYDLNSLVIQDVGATIPLGGNNASQGDTTGSRTAQDQRGGDPSTGQGSSGREEQGADPSSRRERQGQDKGTRASGDARRDGSLFV